MVGHALRAGIANALFAGTTPYLVTWLNGTTGNLTVGACYIMAIALITLPAVVTMKDGSRRPLPANWSDEHTPAPSPRGLWQPVV